MNQRREQEIKLFGIIGIVLALTAAFMQYRPADAAVKWISYDEAFRLAKEQRKTVYVDVYAEWCAPCKMMDRTTFTNDTVVNMLQNDLVAVRVNIDDERTGAEVKKKYTIRAMPTSLLLTPDGQEIKRNVGYMGSTQFLDWVGDTSKISFALWYNFPTARAAAVKEKKLLLVLVMHDSLHISGLQEKLRRTDFQSAMIKKYVPALLTGINPTHTAFIKQYSLIPSLDFVAAFYVFEPVTMDIRRVIPVRQSDMFRLQYVIQPLFSDEPS